MCEEEPGLALSGDRGAAQLEYGLLASFIAIVVAVALGPLGQAVSSMFIDAVNAF